MISAYVLPDRGNRVAFYPHHIASADNNSRFLSENLQAGGDCAFFAKITKKNGQLPQHAGHPASSERDQITGIRSEIAFTKCANAALSGN